MEGIESDTGVCRFVLWGACQLCYDGDVIDRNLTYAALFSPTGGNIAVLLKIATESKTGVCRLPF